MAEQVVDRAISASLRWWRRVPERVADAGLGVVVALGSALLIALKHHPSTTRPAGAFAYLVVVAPALALAWRRRAPVAVYLLSVAASLVYLGLRYPEAPGLGAFVIALYTIA